MTRALTNEEFLRRLSKITSTIQPLEPYVRSSIKIKVKCLVCGNIWMQTPSEIFSYGCPHCGYLKRRLPLKEVSDRIHKKFPYINIIGDYIDLAHEVLFRCDKCGRTWEITPRKVLFRKKMGCPYCDKNIHSVPRRTNEEFLSELHEINDTIQPLEPYHRGWDLIKVKCKVCGRVWKIAPSNLLRGNGCRRCSGHQSRPDLYLSKDEALKRLRETHPYIKLISEYKGIGEASQFECIRCGFVFTNTISYLMKVAKDCPYCSKICYSRQEEILKRYFDENDVNYQFSYKPLYNPLTNQKLHFDFYLPDFGLLIEIQGYQHFKARNLFGGQSGLKYLQLKDRYKKRWAVQQGYCLMYINFNEHTVETFLSRLNEIRSNYNNGDFSLVVGERFYKNGKLTKGEE